MKPWHWACTCYDGVVSRRRAAAQPKGTPMESSAYPMLFSPINVGTTQVKNRVFMPPVSTNMADHGYVTQ